MGVKQRKGVSLQVTHCQYFVTQHRELKQLETKEVKNFLPAGYQMVNEN